jgi:hypothetical protein
MTWPFWMLSGLGWLALWIWVIATRAAVKDDDPLVETFGSLLPAFCATTCLAAFLAVPVRQPVFHKITLWAHHASIFLLFLFLTTAEYFQVEAWWRIRCGCLTRSVAASVRRLWVLTETMPAAIASVVFLTGLRLIWDSPQANSPSSLWLFALILGFSLFFWDGILGYQPIVRCMWGNCKRAIQLGIPLGAAPPTAVYLTDTLQLLIHFLSWPLVFLFGVFRWNAVTPLTQPVSQVTDRLRFLPPGWPEVTTAALLWLVAGIAVFLFRVAFRFRQHSER